VTVIIPTRDRRRFLERSVRDVLRQADVELELLVVDDGSHDAGAVEGIERLDPRIRLIRHDERRGVAAARNTGVANARGGWVAFLDDDDRWAPTKLRTQLGAAESAAATWAYCAALTIDQDDRVLFVTRPGQPSTVDWLGLVNPVPGGCSNVLARTELVREVGGFDERLALLADWDLWIRLAAGAAPAVCEEALVAYRLHPDNMHIRQVEAVDGELDYLAEKFRTEREGVRHDLLVWPALPWQAKAYRRAGRRGHAARLYLQRWRLTRDARDLAQAVLSLVGEPAIRIVRRHWARGRLPRPGWLDADASPAGAAEAGPGAASAAGKEYAERPS
jgi:glycosyltransferase involved in cell wall biosynthesis